MLVVIWGGGSTTPPLAERLLSGPRAGGGFLSPSSCYHDDLRLSACLPSLHPSQPRQRRFPSRRSPAATAAIALEAAAVASPPGLQTIPGRSWRCDDGRSQRSSAMERLVGRKAGEEPPPMPMLLLLLLRAHLPPPAPATEEGEREAADAAACPTAAVRPSSQSAQAALPAPPPYPDAAAGWLAGWSLDPPRPPAGGEGCNLGGASARKRSFSGPRQT